MKLRLWQRLFLTFAALSSLVLPRSCSGSNRRFVAASSVTRRSRTRTLQPVTRRLATAYADNAGWSFLRGDEHSSV
jgi:hypothetical protein